MIRRVRSLVATALVATVTALSATPALASDWGDRDYLYTEYDTDPAGVGPDTLILRPLGIVAFFAGLGLFVPAAVITVITGHPTELDKPLYTFVERPGEYVFIDPIGSH